MKISKSDPGPTFSDEPQPISSDAVGPDRVHNEGLQPTSAISLPSSVGSPSPQAPAEPRQTSQVGARTSIVSYWCQILPRAIEKLGLENPDADHMVDASLRDAFIVMPLCFALANSDLDDPAREEMRSSAARYLQTLWEICQASEVGVEDFIALQMLSSIDASLRTMAKCEQVRTAVAELMAEELRGQLAPELLDAILTALPQPYSRFREALRQELMTCAQRAEAGDFSAPVLAQYLRARGWDLGYDRDRPLEA